MTTNTPSVKERNGTLVYNAKTADLWTVINTPAIEVQVSRAGKDTLFRTINWFSRRLTELREAFRKEGIEVTVSRKEDGSWVTIVRHDDIFIAGPVLVTPDDQAASSSGVPSGSNSRNRNKLEQTEATRIEIEQPKQEGNT
jgi:hypothetical protein